jgi:CubicO group peptidase (beta-lactamase class C family)
MLTHTTFSQSLPQLLDAVLMDAGQQHQTADALLVIRNGAVLYKKAVGYADLERGVPANAQTNFRMASVTKQFTAAAILLLEKQGRLSLQQPLSDFFPELSGLGENVTLCQLLDHTSGLVDYEDRMPAYLSVQLLDADVLDLVKGVKDTYFPPGTAFRYSNTGYCLLALLVERASGQSFADFMKTQVFMPLGMEHSRMYEAEEEIPNRAFGYALNEKDSLLFSDQSLTSATKGDGGIYTSLDDYEKWFRFRQEKLAIEVEAAFPACEFALPDLPDSFYGLGWFIVRRPGQPLALFHSGSTCGFSNMVMEIPEQNTLVVFFSNLASHHEAFGPVYEVLEASGILPKNLALWELYLKTR